MLGQHFLDPFVYSGLPHVKLSDSLFALFSDQRQNYLGVWLFLFGEEVGREVLLRLMCTAAAQTSVAAAERLSGRT